MRRRSLGARLCRRGSSVSILVLLVVFWSHPALAQLDMSGMWRPIFHIQDGNGMDGDYAGIPVSRAGLLRAQTFVGDKVDVPEWVCKPHELLYSMEAGAAELRLTRDVDPFTQNVVGYTARISMREQESAIWLDDRPRPPSYALHTWSGFSIGTWEGDVLVETITHLKEAHVRRYQVMYSDEATARIRWRRIGDYLQGTVIIHDPVYFAEPYIRSDNHWIYDPALVLPPYPCEDATQTVVAPGEVAHHLPGTPHPLPGQNPDVTDSFGTPYETRMGGPETMYPEYIKKMKTLPRPSVVLDESGRRIRATPVERPR